ncbi:Rid family hydrolase [Dongia sedimenti]|uniref:Rid family hydrolase n=1 Tax=Dongia sedimenti TaxID=3064282 RepID=A0ABU0YVZ1_9PROT|nr:Rid family hydrolase [Rhodospirillaceae bacterium R-7]
MSKTHADSEVLFPKSPIERLPGKAPGRCLGSGFGSLAFLATVAHDRDADLTAQARDALARLDAQLSELGSSRAEILSATVFLADLTTKPQFDAVWVEWIGQDRQAWPQRVCVGAALAGSTLVEISAIAARSQFVAKA